MLGSDFFYWLHCGALLNPEGWALAFPCISLDIQVPPFPWVDKDTSSVDTMMTKVKKKYVEMQMLDNL